MNCELKHQTSFHNSLFKHSNVRYSLFPSFWPARQATHLTTPILPACFKFFRPLTTANYCCLLPLPPATSLDAIKMCIFSKRKKTVHWSLSIQVISPYPPPPGVSIRMTSPFLTSMVSIPFNFTFSPEDRIKTWLPAFPGKPPSIP